MPRRLQATRAAAFTSIAALALISASCTSSPKTTPTSQTPPDPALAVAQRSALTVAADAVTLAKSAHRSVSPADVSLAIARNINSGVTLGKNLSKGSHTVVFQVAGEHSPVCVRFATSTNPTITHC